MKISVKLTPKDVVFYQFWLIQTDKRRKRLYFSKQWTFPALFLLSTVVAATLFRSYYVFAAGASIAVLLVATFSMRLSLKLRNSARKMFNDGGFSEIQEYILEEDGLTQRVPHREAKVKWPLIKDVILVGAYAFIKLDEDNAYVIPGDSVIAGDYPAFVAALKAKLGEKSRS